MRSVDIFSIAWRFVITLQILSNVQHANGHGRLMDPPSRNAMWRFGFPNPVNYNDNELFCGGYAVQWETNGGKCGVCGDAVNMPKPRPHEAGGQFAKGIIGRRYSVGQEIDIEVELTANHWGRFDIALCPTNTHVREATQECFNKHPLLLTGSREQSFVIPPDSHKKDIFRYKVRLPPYLTCSQCVLQWTYYTGNMWGTCPNGTEAVGCGKAEMFRNCADISIVTNTGSLPPSAIVQDNPFLLYYRDLRAPPSKNVFPLVVRDQVCVPTPLYRLINGFGDWCQRNCLRYPPNCPETVCHCPQTCRAIGELEGKEGADIYCQDACIIYPPRCPAHRCSCY